ncbi:MAG: DUF4396 domain-containing protein [Rhizobiales bacterium]|nr:DUF4396 domain-containing protein [Hyphomicrobiales bacterium]
MVQNSESCCSSSEQSTDLSGSLKNRPGFISSAKATMHCLTGCTIGEVLGLIIGVSAGFTPFYTIALAVFLAFLIGFAMAIHSVQSSEGLGFVAAFRAVWLGEVISMGIMEFVMNVVDYSVGGMHATSIFTGVFWLGIGLAIPAGFLAAWPVNYWLLSKEIKNCCH